MAERVLHCWAGNHDTDGLALDSEEYICIAVARETEEPATCLLEAGHAGPHEWTPDSKITITFADPATPQAQEA